MGYVRIGQSSNCGLCCLCAGGLMVENPVLTLMRTGASSMWKDKMTSNMGTALSGKVSKWLFL